LLSISVFQKCPNHSIESGLFDSLLRFSIHSRGKTAISSLTTGRSHSPLKKPPTKFAPYHETPFDFHLRVTNPSQKPFHPRMRKTPFAAPAPHWENAAIFR